MPRAALLAAALAAVVAVAAGDGNEPCDAGEECPDHFAGLLQVNLAISPSFQPPTRPGARYNQLLENAQDLQYAAGVMLGGQPIQAVLDTGSFELLAFGKSCGSCGVAQGYDYSVSRTYLSGQLTTTHTFGSGSCVCIDGTDVLRIGTWEVAKQSFWEVIQAYMPVLNSATFQAILGLAPPGEPQMQAKTMLQQGGKENQQIAELVMAKNDSVLMNLGVRYFSACFEWTKGSPGHLIWNDAPPPEQPVAFAELEVASDIHWRTTMTAARLQPHGGREAIDIGCQAASCEALLDTGTSLIAVPQATFQKVLSELNELDQDCTNLEKMPNLVFKLGGHSYSLPPQTYIGIIEGYVNADAMPWMAPQKKAIGCRLLLMSSGGFGSNMWILGMPFFRYYYTTFDLGGDPYNKRGRRIWTAPASFDCQPTDGPGYEKKLGFAKRQRPWRINGTLIRPPKLRSPERPGEAPVSEISLGRIRRASTWGN